MSTIENVEKEIKVLEKCKGDRRIVQLVAYNVTEKPYEHFTLYGDPALDEWLSDGDKNGGLDWTDIAWLMKSLFECLQAFHKKNFVHIGPSFSMLGLPVFPNEAKE